MTHRNKHSAVPIRVRPSAVLGLAIAAALSSGSALADAQLGSALVERLQTALPGDELSVVVTWDQEGPVAASELQALTALGIERGVSFRSLPIARSAVLAGRTISDVVTNAASLAVMLVVGIWLPAVGLAAAAGLVLYFGGMGSRTPGAVVLQNTVAHLPVVGR